MKKWLTIIGSVLIAGIGAFFLFNAFIKSGVPALDHAFTRGFIDTSADTGEEGFYLFESGTGEFTMHYPGDFVMHESQGRYSVTADRFELINSQKELELEKDGLVTSLKVMYRGNLVGGDPSKNWEFEDLLDDFSYDGNYDSYESDYSYIRHGSSIGKMTDNRRDIYPATEGDTNQYFAFVEDKQSDKFISISLTIICTKNLESECTIKEEYNEKLFDHVVESIRFNEA